MAFDWLQFFDAHHIDYVSSGANVGKGNVAIKCVYCGVADESHHLSVSLEGYGWRCWRRPQEHKGKNPARLVQALLGCSWEQAQHIIGNSTYIPDDFQLRVRYHLEPIPIKLRPITLKLPAEFKPLSNLPSCRPYLQYLERRGFSKDTVSPFGLRYCTKGPYHGRIMFPIYADGKLVTWTGRSIYRGTTLRYKTLSEDFTKAQKEGLPAAVNPITQYLLWQDELIKTNARTVYLCEGPFDSLKICVLGQDKGIISTCFFTSAPTDTQIELLHEILPRFKYRYLLLDQEALPTSLYVNSLLNGLDVRIKQLPSRISDPGSLNNIHELLALT